MKSELGALIAKHRIRCNLTQAELAQRINTRKTNISNYETGYSRPDELTLRKISEVVGVDLLNLISNDIRLCNKLKPKHKIDQKKHVKNKINIYDIDNYTGLVAMNSALADGIYYFPDDPLYNTNDIFAIKLLDNSMSKSYLPSGSIGIFRYDIPAQNNTIVAVNIKKTEKIVVRYYTNEGGLILLTDNSYYTEPKTSQYYEDDIEILGCLVTKIVHDNA